MWQQGQVFKLKAKGADGQPPWAYRYRLEGRGSARPQVGGFATRSDALKALERVLARLRPGRAATMTLGELVDEYLEMHQAERVTIAKLRWLLGKATVVLGEVRLGGALAERHLRVAADDPRRPQVRSDAGASRSRQHRLSAVRFCAQRREGGEQRLAQ
jgi:hypothetical protein